MRLLREDIRDSLVQAGQQACGYMNCKLFVQTVTGIPKLDALPSRPFRSIGDLATGDVLKWGTGTHWAIYVGEGEVMEVEDWGAPTRIVSFAEVLEEIDPPDTVFSTTSAPEMLIREYVRALLTEGAKGPADLKRVEGSLVRIRRLGDRAFEVSLYRHADPEKKWTGQLMGVVAANSFTPDPPCKGAYMVSWAHVERPFQSEGWGPMLYDIAMELATMAGSGLIADRGVVSPLAFNVWKYYADSRGDVEKVQLDDREGRLTPEDKEDDCDQQRVYRGKGTDYFWEPEVRDEEWDPYGKEVLLKHPLSKMYRSRGTPTIRALESMGKIIIS